MRQRWGFSLIHLFHSTLDYPGTGTTHSFNSPVMQTIDFWRPDEKPFGLFSNYHPTPVLFDGQSYYSTEAAYQAAKFEDPWYCNEIRLSRTAHQARMLARQETSAYKWATEVNALIAKSKQLGLRPRSDWDQVKLSVMERVVRAKLEQHSHIAKLLLETGETVIREVSPFDTWWGVGRDGKGRNELGLLLTRERTRLRQIISVR